MELRVADADMAAIYAPPQVVDKKTRHHNSIVQIQTVVKSKHCSYNILK